MADVEKLWAELEAEGEESVRRKLPQDLYGPPLSIKKTQVEGWLAHRELLRKEAESRARKKREERTEAREVSRDRFARITAIVALIISLLSLLIGLSK